MSDLSEDLKWQMDEGKEPTIKSYLEKKPGYDGPTLNDADHEKLRRERVEMHEKNLKRLQELGAKLRE